MERGGDSVIKMINFGRAYDRRGLRSIQASAICEAGNSRSGATWVKRWTMGLSIAAVLSNNPLAKVSVFARTVVGPERGSALNCGRAA
jgi:hypothetical protein